MSAQRPSAPWRMVSTAGAVRPGLQGRPAETARGLPEAPPAGTAHVVPLPEQASHGARGRAPRLHPDRGPRRLRDAGPVEQGFRTPGAWAGRGRACAARIRPAGRGRGPVPARVSAGLVPGPAPSAPRLRLGPGPAAAPAGTGSTPGTATGGPADRVVLLSPQDADWGFASPSRPRDPGTEINPVLPGPHGLLTAPVASEATGAGVGGPGNRGPAGGGSLAAVRRQGHALAAHGIGTNGDPGRFPVGVAVAGGLWHREQATSSLIRGRPVPRCVPGARTWPCAGPGCAGCT